MRRARVILAALLLVLTSAEIYAQDDVRAAALVGLARVSRDGGNLFDAARYYEQARALRPLTDAETTEYFWIVRSVDPRRALELGREALQHKPQDDNVRDASIGAAIAIGDETAVRTLAIEGRGVSGNIGRWHRRLGDSFQRTGRIGDAADAYQAAASAPDGLPADRLAAATALTSAERYTEALTMWRTVPPALVNAKPETARLRLLAFARVAPASEARAEIAGWQRNHGFDATVQSWLVDLLVREAQYADAYAATEALTTGAEAERWIRRRAELARLAGVSREAIAAYQALILTPRATADDRLALLEMLVEQGASEPALPVFDSLVAQLRPCDQQLLVLGDRLPGAAATDRLRAAAARGGCLDSRWGERIVERSVAEKRYPVALAVLQQLSTTSPESLRLRGQLQLWTGAAADAIATIEPLVATRPGDVEARLTLIDALRAVDRAYDAFAAAAPLLGDLTLATDRVLALAELAVDADRPDVADGLLARVPDPGLVRVQAIRGRALLARGRPRDAAAVIAALPPAALPPSAALALIDAVLETSGAEAASSAAGQFPALDAAWHDVAVRQLMLEVALGHEARADALRHRLCSADARPCRIATAEAHLRVGQPELALSELERISADDIPRIDEVRASALEATGDLPGALASVLRLQARAPANTRLAYRALRLEWRVRRDPDTLDRLVAFAEEHREDARVRAEVARLILDQGDAARGVAFLTHGESSLSDEGRLLLVEALAATGRLSDALAALDPVATSESATALKARLLAQVAADQLRRGEHRRALDTASEALALEGSSTGAWLTAIDAAAAADADDRMSALLDEVRAVAARNPGVIIAVGNHVAAVAQAHDRVARTLVEIVNALPEPRTPDVLMTQARLYASLEEWTSALRVLDVARANSPRAPEVLRLRADVLGWSGQHGTSIAAYDEYLAVAPSDLDARRQQARVTGWSGRYGEANRRYAALTERYPDHPAVAAEAAAKRALYAGQWRAAVRAYDSWIGVEPDNSEARFERAIALRSAGNRADADLALNDLAVQTGHRLAALALDRSEQARQPSLSAGTDFRSASGFGGSRLLTLHQQRAALSIPMNEGAAHMEVAGGPVRAENALQTRPGYRATLDAQAAVSARLSLEGALGVWAFSSLSTPEARIAATLNPAGHLAIVAGIEQRAVLENLGTVDSGLHGRGPFAGLRFVTPTSSVDTVVSWQRLSDGNTRRELTISAGRAVSERLQSVRVVAWAQSLRYASAQPGYFSPGSFLRLDGGAEFTRTLQRPRFTGDRQGQFVVSFLEGTDSHGVLYHHPGVRLHLQLARRVAVHGRAEWIRSASYRETALFVGLDLADLASH